MNLDYLGFLKIVVSKAICSQRYAPSTLNKEPMRKSWHPAIVLRSLTASSVTLAIALPGVAQIVPDTTLPNNSTVNLEGTVRRIGGGTTVEENLFHSFGEFSVPAGTSAHFDNALEIENIFSRVTGTNISNIDGLITANGSASLFLLNPNGIVFGPNAMLDIGGSFFASTADRIVFNNDSFFSAREPNAPPLLTVNVPLGLQYGANPGEIRVEGLPGNPDEFLLQESLQVKPEETLALIGGNVTVDGGLLEAPGGRIELGGLAAPGIVQVNGDRSLSFPDGVERADILLTNSARISTLGQTGGDIVIRGRTITIEGNSILETGVAEQLPEESAQDDSAQDDSAQDDSAQIDSTEGQEGEIILDETQANSTETDETAQTDEISEIDSAEVQEGEIILDETQADSTETDETAQEESAQIDSAQIDSTEGQEGEIILDETEGQEGEIILDETQADSAELDSAQDDSAQIDSAQDDSAQIDSAEGEIILDETQGDSAELDAAERDFPDLNSDFPELDSAEPDSAELDSDFPELNSDFPELDSAELDSAELDSAELDSAELDSAELDSAELDSADMDSAEMDSAEMDFDSAQLDSAEVGNIDLDDMESDLDMDEVELLARARNLILNDGIMLDSDSSEVDSSEAVSGDITLDATGAINIESSQISSLISFGTVGNGGEIRINAGSLSLSNADLDATNFGRGNAGNIELQVNGAIAIANSRISSDAFAEVSGLGGSAGFIEISGADSVAISNSTISTEGASTADLEPETPVGLSDGAANAQTPALDNSQEFSRAGEIAIESRTISILDNSTLSSTASGNTQGGSILLRAREGVRVVGSSIASDTANENITEESVQSNINIFATEGSVELNEAFLSTINSSSGLAGDIFINAGEEVSIVQSNLSSTGNTGSTSIGMFGEQGEESLFPRSVLIDNSVLTANNDETINADENTPINAGSIAIGARENLAIVNQSEVVATTSRLGDAGNVTLEVANGDIVIANNTQVSTDSTETAIGEGGNIEIATNRLRVLDSAELSATTQNDFPGGNIIVNSNVLELTSGGQIITTAFGRGAAGSITINATDRVALSGQITITQSDVIENILAEVGVTQEQSSQVVEALSSENILALLSSDQNLQSSRVQGETLLVAAGLTEEQAGMTFDLLLERIEPQTALLAQSENIEGTGSGEITISTGSFSLSDGANIETSTLGAADAGQVTIRARDSVSLSRGLILSNVSQEGTGKGGSININARSVSLDAGSSLDSGTFGEGDAGEILLQVDGAISIAGASSLYSDVGSPDAEGNGGRIEINTGSLDISNNAFIETNTLASGDAGNIVVNARNAISLRNGSRVSSSSQGTGTAGNVTINASSLELNQGRIQANTASGNGGNIAVRVMELLRHDRNSSITTNAGTEGAGGNGGNIVLNADFLIGSGNSDISANAFEGSGGFIQINTTGVFGLQVRNRQTSKSDITAISQQNPNLRGEIQINSPEVDSGGLVEIPTNFVDVEGLVDRDLCAAARQGSSFSITGRGGLPPNPAEPLNGSGVLVEWAESGGVGEMGGENFRSILPYLSPPEPVEGFSIPPHPSPSLPLPPPPSHSPVQIVEATGWIVAEDGTVILTANPPKSKTENLDGNRLSHPGCR